MAVANGDRDRLVDRAARIASAIPFVNVIALGYLMEIQGRAARTGKLRSAIHLVPAAAVGIVLLAVWLSCCPSSSAPDWPATVGRWRRVGGRSVVERRAGLRECAHRDPSGAGDWLRGSLVAVSSDHERRWLWSGRSAGGDYWRDADRAIREFLADSSLRQSLRLGLIGYPLRTSGEACRRCCSPCSRMRRVVWQMVIGFVVGCITVTTNIDLVAADA